MAGRTRPWVLAAIAVAALGAGVFWWATRPAVAPASPPEAVATPDESTPKHPLAPLSAEPSSQVPLPSLADSDPALVSELETLQLDTRWQEVFQVDNIVRRWVITIDALPRQRIVQRTSPVQRVGGEIATASEADTLVLAHANYARYDKYLTLAEAIDPKQAVDVYRKFYPLFQQAYTELIRPDGYFNDRLIAVLDHLLAARVVTQELQLVQPGVMFQFADPELEALSVGEKALLRMGPENAQRAKAVIERLRSEVLAATEQ